MFDLDKDTFNAITNVVTLLGGALLSALIIYILIQVWRISERLEQVIAPKSGIENHLSMCERAVECDPDGTCIVDDDGLIVLINKAMEDLSGYHRSELHGQKVEVLVPDATKAEHPRHREGFVTEPSSRPMRGLRLRHKRGREIAVGINLNHYRDTSGGYTIAKVRLPDEDWRRSGEINRFIE